MTWYTLVSSFSIVVLPHPAVPTTHTLLPKGTWKSDFEMNSFLYVGWRNDTRTTAMPCSSTSALRAPPAAMERSAPFEALAPPPSAPCAAV